MDRLLAFVKKEFLHIFRDQRTLLILFGMPLVMVTLFGFALTNEIKNARVAILDNDHGIHSRQITDKLLSSGYFQLDRNLYSYREIETAFRQGKLKLALVFPANFTDDYEHGRSAQVQLVSDASEQNTALSLVNYATAIIRDYSAGLTPTAHPPMQVNIISRMVYNPELKGVFVFVPGVMTLVLLLISAMMTSITIAREKEVGTMEVLLVSPLSQFQILLGKMVPYMLLSFINGCVIMGLGVWLLGMPLNGSLGLLLAETLLYIVLSLSLGLLISSMVNTQLLAMFGSMIVLLMPSLFLSGFLFPIASMPRLLQVISNIIPAKYFIEVIKGIMIKGVGLSVLWRETTVLAGMTALFIVLTLRNLKPRLA
ncbi:ABC transporter permease [Spirosoma sp. SC4-14]|uniref:ABC transporter permease n=1 Tax=Spirosoma sp. SC4-14 TaxID=3128900 RepID=UPI0030D172A6